jgi:1-acyl-sn-glycerol-3-phosphate acyltransferase
MIPALLLLATLVVLIPIVGLIFIPWTLITGNVVPLYRATNWLVRTAYWVSGIRIAVEGRERVPKGTACIFMANHVSNLDPQALIPEIPGRTSAFLKRSLMKIPILLDKGIHITTFVEGTRSKDGRMLPFKKGPFYLAMQTGAPCIPVSIYGTETMMAKGSLRLKPGTAHIVFHAPVNPADYATREELLEAVRAAIASGLPEWMRG